MKKAEARLAELSIKVNKATWVHDNFITEDTEALAANANDENTAVTTELVEQAKRFEGLRLPPELARKFKLLKLSLTAPAPKDPALRRELTQIAASLESDYGKGKYCRKPDDCLDITSIESIMGTSRDANELKDLWTGWHKVGAALPCASAMRALSSSRTKVRAKLDSKIPARCGDRTTTCLPTRSALIWSGCGSRFGRFIFRYMPMSAPNWCGSTDRRWFLQTVLFPLIS